MARPEHLEWTEELYGTGVEVVDAQHRELFDRVNLLIDAIASDRAEAEVPVLLQFLASYTVRHFQCEERVMSERNCSACKRNASEHQWFVEQLGELQEHHRQHGADAAFAKQLLERLAAWIDHHIRQVDSELRGA